MLNDENNFRLSRESASGLVDAIMAIVSALDNSVKNADCLLHLWNFIFLSHPASDTYLERKIHGHADWLNLSWFF